MTPPTAQFWLKIGEIPSGPMTLEQVHIELAEGRATWQTLACPIGTGESVWRPLVQTPGIGPVVDTITVPQQVVLSTPAPTPDRPVLPTESRPDRFSRRCLRWLGRTLLVFMGLTILFVIFAIKYSFKLGPIIRITDWISSPPTSPTSPATEAAKPSANPPSPPPAPKEEYKGWNLGGPPVIPSHLVHPNRSLIGSWSDSDRNYVTILTFHSSGRFVYTSQGQAPDFLLPLVGPSISGTWRYQDQGVHLDYREPNAVPWDADSKQTLMYEIDSFDYNQLTLTGTGSNNGSRKFTRVR